MNFYLKDGKHNKIINVKRFTEQMAHIDVTFIWNHYYHCHSDKSRLKLARFMKNLGSSLENILLDRMGNIKKLKGK